MNKVAIPESFFVEELGRYVFNHRLYSPETMRWDTKDPIGFPDGINNSLYVSGDPISKLDPLGTSESYSMDMSQQVSGGGSAVQVRYTYHYGKSRKPEYATGSANIPSSTNSAGWSSPAALVDCYEPFPSPYPNSNQLLYWKDTPATNNQGQTLHTLEGTAFARYNGIGYDSRQGFDTPPFEK